MGTDPCGFPRNGIVSDPDSHGSIFGCCLKSVNHEHAASRSNGANRALRAMPRSGARIPHPAARVPRSSLTTNLLCPMLPEDVHRVLDAIGIGGDPHAEVTTAESR